MEPSSSFTVTTTVLGKRSRDETHVGVIHLSSSCSEYSDLEPARPKPVLINGKLVAHTKRRYHCTFEGCNKAYTKPSRLEEHERSHTGERPFICETCNKSYLRETHLQAHARSHLPESSRPLACDTKGCEKRFWTAQHLKAHQDWHDGARPFACREEDCQETFAKHHQLRAHVCEVHAPPGTKPYRCDHEGCEKSFDTNQHLKTHKKAHNAKRYTCVQGSCLAQRAAEPEFFANWTALQHHIRTAHPPTCLFPSCNGRVFASHKGLRSHHKLHEQQDAEEQLRGTLSVEDERPGKRARRGGELGRDWQCEFQGCDRDFKSKKALTTHQNVNHLGKRDFVCSDCDKAFGYKHLLQRHAARIHAQPADEVQQNGSESDADDEDDESEHQRERGHIDAITGKAYADQRKSKAPPKFLCPFPDVSGLEGALTPSSTLRCDHGFSRIYDLRRHFQAAHKIETSKEGLQSWIQKRNKRP